MAIHLLIIGSLPNYPHIHATSLTKPYSYRVADEVYLFFMASYFFLSASPTDGFTASKARSKWRWETLPAAPEPSASPAFFRSRKNSLKR